MQETHQNYRSVQFIASSPHFDHSELVPVVSAEGLAKHDVFRLPDPFAVITVDSEQRYVTSMIEKTLDPYWNEDFDVSVIFFLDASLVLIFYVISMVNNSSVITAQIFDQRKFKRRDEGFLGIVNIEIANYLDLEFGGHSMFSSFGIAFLLFMTS
jgi:E3 ubiquitin-protein ligase NEDD4